MEHQVSAAKSSFLGGNLGAKPCLLGDGDLDDSFDAPHEGLHLQRAEVNAVLGHRAGMADLAPRQKRKKTRALARGERVGS